MSWSVLEASHPHEDAYILFKYARNLADGHGIVYYAGGPHAEGATDFLWMILLALGHRLGLDVAYSAALANAAGAGLLVWALGRMVVPTGWARIAIRWMALCVLLTGPALASYVGFSALLYSGLCTWLFSLSIEAVAVRRPSMLIPWLALTLGLFRPDGVLIGGTFVLVGLWTSFRAGAGRTFAMHCALALIPALAYAAWRRVYFGLALPLPLYVKGHSVSNFSFDTLLHDPAVALPGLPLNWNWLTSWNGALPFLLALCLLLFQRRSRRDLVVVGVGLAPALVLLFSLCLALQSQNVGSRFQGPALFMLMASVFYVAGQSRPLVGVLSGSLALLPGLLTTSNQVHRIWLSRGYLNTMAVELGKLLPAHTTLAAR